MTYVITRLIWMYLHIYTHIHIHSYMHMYTHTYMQAKDVMARQGVSMSVSLQYVEVYVDT